MADNAPVISYANAKKLFKYVTDPNRRRHGVSEAEPMGSGPGGAGATNRLVSRQAAKITSMPGYKGKMQELKDDVADVKLRSDTRGMKETTDIYNEASRVLRQKKQRYTRDRRFEEDI